MAALTLHGDDEPTNPLATIELGTPDSTGYYESGDLAYTSGNLYFRIDGEEYGSLFFFNRDGRPEVTLGQYDRTADEHVFRNPLTESVNEIVARVIRPHRTP